jgi:hypothetical protein
MRMVLFLAASALTAPAYAGDAPVSSATPVVAYAGQMLRDSHNVRLGSVDAVRPDGSVAVIFESRYVVVPANSLTVVNGKLITSLTKDQVGAL